jgi:excisionase family DNA binding protein
MTSKKEEKAMPKLWTVESVAEYWGVSKNTVFRLIHARRIVAICVGRSYRIPDDVVRNGATKPND